MKQTVLTLSILFLYLFSFSAFSQENEGVKSIKVKKESFFVKAAFDEGEYKVVALDRYGNPHEKAIKSFSIVYSDGKTAYEALVVGNVFPDKTIRFLTKKATATKICLTNLVAAGEDGHEEKLPDLCDIIIFPVCKKVHKK